MSFLTNLFSGEKNALDTYRKELDLANSYADEITKLSQEEIRKEILEFRSELGKFEHTNEIKKKLWDIAPRVFALVREATKRALNKPHFDVQIIGGFVLAKGGIAEMKTGEGKTQTAVLSLVLYALAGKGAHIVTVNDYLARWHASIMGPIFHYLGLSVASIQHEQSFLYDTSYQPDNEEIERLQGQTQGLVMDVKHMRPISRKEAYAADVTYGTNNEFGFDYLRDNMVQHFEQMVQRDLFFAIVDEVDSILIDEARTPLIISMPDSDPTQKYYDFAKMVDKLEAEKDYLLNEKHKTATLTDEGINRVEDLLKVKNIYDTTKGVQTLHHIEQALRARANYLRDRDYVVREGEVIIVDEFTGRLMYGRRYSEGLHQAIEAKEGVKIQAESKTLATITFQNLFRLYDVLSGMTGTAKTEEEEFFKIYQLLVTPVPTHKPMVRSDLADVIYKTEDAKFKAIAKEVKERHANGQPILIGTVSIAKNELLAEYLKKEGLSFEILNAKNHEREAHIISQAGRFKAITLATNIAGRGVDILLGGNPVDEEEAKAVREAGGMHILGSERHESRRIDNQLRGRAGRQGDPGSSQFFCSMEDDLMRLFGGERMKGLMTKLGLPDDQPIEAKLVSRSIESAQKKIEGLNFDTRKHVLEFDDVLNHQRNVIYKRRRKYLTSNNILPVSPLKKEEEVSTSHFLEKNEPEELLEEHTQPKNIKDEILDLIHSEISDIVTSAITMPEEAFEDKKTALDYIFEGIGVFIPLNESLKGNIQEAYQNAGDREFAITDSIFQFAEKYYEEKEQEFGKEIFEGALRYVVLQSLDNFWMDHLDTMDHLRDSVRLRGYGQRDPLVEYKKEGFAMFQRLMKEIDRQIVYTIFKINIQVQKQSPVIDQNKLVTNLSDGSSNKTSSAPKDPKFESIGRNDPCPCGSGKKYKRCGLINSEEHQKLMSQKVA